MGVRWPAMQPPREGWRHVYLSVARWPPGAGVSWASALALEARLRGSGARLADPVASLLVGGEAPMGLGEALPAAVREATGLRPHQRVGEWTVEVDPVPELAAWAPAWAREGVTRLVLRGGAADPHLVSRIRQAAPSLALSVEFDLDRADPVGPRLEALIAAGVSSVALVEPDAQDEPADVDDASGVRREGLATRDPSRAWHDAIEVLVDLGWVLADLAFAHAAGSGTAGRGPRHPRAIRSREPVLGLGPGAVTFRNPFRQWNLPDAVSYLAAVSAGRKPGGGGEHLAPDEVRLERIWAGLRRSRGLRCPHPARIVPRNWHASGWIRPVPGRIVPTREGWRHADTLAVELAARIEQNGRPGGSGGSTDGAGAESFKG